MELKDPPDPRGGALVLLAKDESKAIGSLTAALAKLREPWEA